MCSVCRRKQTTARNEAGEVCCVGCGVWMEEVGRGAVLQLVRGKLNHPHQVVMMMHLMHLVQRRGVQLILPERNSPNMRSCCLVLFEREWADGCKCWALRTDAYLSLSCILWCSIALRNQFLHRGCAWGACASGGGNTGSASCRGGARLQRRYPAAARWFWPEQGAIFLQDASSCFWRACDGDGGVACGVGSV